MDPRQLDQLTDRRERGLRNEEWAPGPTPHPEVPPPNDPHPERLSRLAEEAVRRFGSGHPPGASGRSRSKRDGFRPKAADAVRTYLEVAVLGALPADLARARGLHLATIYRRAAAGRRLVEGGRARGFSDPDDPSDG